MTEPVVPGEALQELEDLIVAWVPPRRVNPVGRADNPQAILLAKVKQLRAAVARPALPAPPCPKCGESMRWSGNDGSDINGWFCNAGHEIVVRAALPAPEPPLLCRHGEVTQCGFCAGERADEIEERLAQR